MFRVSELNMRRKLQFPYLRLNKLKFIWPHRKRDKSGWIFQIGAKSLLKKKDVSIGVFHPIFIQLLPIVMFFASSMLALYSFRKYFHIQKIRKSTGEELRLQIVAVEEFLLLVLLWFVSTTAFATSSVFLFSFFLFFYSPSMLFIPYSLFYSYSLFLFCFVSSSLRLRILMVRLCAYSVGKLDYEKHFGCCVCLFLIVGWIKLSFALSKNFIFLFVIFRSLNYWKRLKFIIYAISLPYFVAV